MSAISPCPKPTRESPEAKKLRLISSARERERRPRKAIAKSSKPITRTAIKKKKRPAKETRRIYGSKDFMAFLHAHECLGCGYRGEHIQQAHVQTGGMGRKDDWTRTGPLCGPRFNSIKLYLDGDPIAAIINGCHHEYDNAKQSFRTWKGQTFATAQKRFFAAWKKFFGSGSEA